MRNLVSINRACIMKLSWNLKENDNRLWCQVLKGKYANRFLGGNSIVAKSSDSSLWKSIVQVWDKSDKFFFWAIGDGASTSVWFRGFYLGTSLLLRLVSSLLRYLSLRCVILLISMESGT